MASEFFPHNMTGNSSPSPYVVSSPSFLATFDPYKAFDGNYSYGQYCLLTSGTRRLQIDLGSGNACFPLTYSIRVNSVPEPNRAPKDWTFEGSNNGSSWDILDTQTNQTGWTSGQLRTFNCLAEITYRYFRITVTANNGDATYTQIGEMYLSGELTKPYNSGFLNFFLP
mgnify:CR=1 FL=1